MMQNEILDAAMRLDPAARRQLAAALLKSADSADSDDEAPSAPSSKWHEDFEQSPGETIEYPPRAISAEDFLRDLDEQVALGGLGRKKLGS